MKNIALAVVLRTVSENILSTGGLLKKPSVKNIALAVVLRAACGNLNSAACGVEQLCLFNCPCPCRIETAIAEHEAVTFDSSLLLEVRVNVDSVIDLNVFKWSSTTFPFITTQKKLWRLALPMSTSPSDSSASFVSHSSSREPTPEWDPIAAYEKQAPLHWDADGWDFAVASESDGDLTDGDDLQFLVDGELDSDTSTEWS